MQLCFAASIPSGARRSAGGREDQQGNFQIAEVSVQKLLWRSVSQPFSLSYDAIKRSWNSIIS
jgi:hypothetical protein